MPSGAPKAKLSAPKVRKVKKATAGAKAKRTVPNSLVKAAKCKTPSEVVCPKSKTPFAKSKVIALRSKKQADKRPTNSKVNNSNRLTLLMVSQCLDEIFGGFGTNFASNLHKFSNDCIDVQFLEGGRERLV